MDGRLVFMENRRDGFSRYLKSLAPYAGERPGAALVMNANPFTLGHAALVARAAKENERVVLFVLSEDRSLVPYSDRHGDGQGRLREIRQRFGRLLRQLHDLLRDVPLLLSSRMRTSSPAPTPSWMRRCSPASRPRSNLTRRYVGEEPFSHTTSLYNEALAAVLPKAGVELVVIPRAQAQGEAISASHVRQLIHDGHIEAIRPLVPETTYAYLTGDAGQAVLRRIQAAADVIHH